MSYFSKLAKNQLILPRMKICCIQSLDEAWLAIKYGASAIGLVSAMPSGPGPIPEEKIREIAATIPPGVTTVLLTSRTCVADIIDQHCYCATNAIQLVDRLTNGTLHELHIALPGISIMQVIHVLDESAIAEAQAAAPFVHAILLDSGNPKAAVKKLGGTGRIHDWQISRSIVETINAPVFLAGGLHAGNLAAAINTTRPFGVDVCSGVRTNGQLDEEKLAAFSTQIKAVADQKII